MQTIGKAKLNIDKFKEYVATENVYADKREAGWYVSVRDHIPSEVKNIIWKHMSKIGEKENYPLYRVEENSIRDIMEHQQYLDKMHLFWELLFLNDEVAVIKSGDMIIGIPANIIEPMEYENVDNIPIGILRNRIGTSNTNNDQQTYLTPSTSKKDLYGMMKDKQDELKSKQEELNKIEKEKEAELDKLKQALEAKYASMKEVLQTKQNELKKQMEVLEGQMFLLETEIYSIRCFMGETVDFTQISKGNHSKEDNPVVLYQKVRYLDEELGKWAAVYNFDGNKLNIFEDLLKTRTELQELFAPGPKSISLVKISKNGVQYHLNPIIANQLKAYATYHGSKIGILLRDGENIWIGWTDEERINIPDGNVFYRPQSNIVEAADEEYVESSSKEETASRYFVYNILRGVLHNRKLIHIPEEVEITEDNPYVIFSLADGWLEDNRYGKFSDIVERTNAPLKKGDMILTTLRIERDDARPNGWGRCTVNNAWNNDRGRGDANRTHDASINDMSVLPINCIDVDKEYAVYYKKYKLDVETIHETKEKTLPDGSVLSYDSVSYKPKRTNEFMGMKKEWINTQNDMICGCISVKDMTPEEIYESEKKRGVFKDEYEDSWEIDRGRPGTYRIYDHHVELERTEYHYYVSAEKFLSTMYGSGEKTARANLEIRENEYLNLTFLNSIYLLYAIQNKKIGGWKRGRHTMDYASSIPYLNKALDYIREREKEEAEMLSKYMDLYDGWQVDLSEWRLSHNYHRLTDLRAKKFAKEINR